MRRRSSAGGWTLTELLAAMVLILTVVAAAMMVLMQTGRQVWSRTDAQMASAASAQRALDRLGEELQAASRATLNCVVANAVSFQPAAGGEPVSYVLNPGTQQLRRLQDGNDQLVVAGIAAFARTCAADNTLARLALTAQINALGGGSATQTLASQVRIQNP